MPEQNNKWRGTQDEFRGYSKAKLDSIHDDIQGLKKLFDGFDARCTIEHGNLQKKVGRTDKKVAAIAGTLALALTVLGYLVQHALR